MARLEAAILVRIDDMDREVTLGQRSIRFELSEIGPETVDGWVASALRDAPELDAAGALPGWSKS